MKKDQMFCSHKVMMRKESCAYLFNKERKKKPFIKKECLCCKKTYETRKPQQLFCANPCKSKDMKIRRQECACGREFRTHRAERSIYDHLAEHGEPLTLQEIARVTGFGINSVSGRVNGLKKKKILQECQKRKCHLTKRMVTPVFIAGDRND